MGRKTKWWNERTAQQSRKPFVYNELERLGENEPEKRNGLHCFTFGLRQGAWKGRFRGYFFTSGFADRLKWDDGQGDCDGAALVAFFCATFENTICKILPYNNYLVYLHHNWDWYGKGDTRTFTMQEPIWAQRLLFCEHISHLYRSEARRSRCDKELSITCRTVRKRHSVHEKGHYKAIYAYPLLKAPGRRRLT